MTDAIFAEILALFSRAYATTYDGETKRVWRVLLEPLPDEAAKAAAISLCRSSPYPPKPADLFRLVQGTAHDADERVNAEAEFAITHVEQHITDYRMLDLGPILNAVIRAMGGPDAIVALMTTGGWKFERARFRALYRAYRMTGVRGAEGDVLVPLAVSEGFLTTPKSIYEERGLPIPLIRAPFGHEFPALGAGGNSSEVQP